MAGFDFAAAQRWAVFDPGHRLERRPDDALPFIAADIAPVSRLLLDACVYIDQLQGRMPARLGAALARCQVNHSTVAVQALMQTVGALNPDDPRSAGAIAAIGRLIDAMLPHRLLAPDPATLGRAAWLSGVLCRLQGYGQDAQLRALQSCTLFLQAQQLGLTVLTANVDDFDLLLQLIPAGQVLLYRR
jgi:hypothetical protein